MCANFKSKSKSQAIENFYGFSDDLNYSNEIFQANSQYFLNKIQTIANLGLYVFNIETGYWISSQKLDEIFGIDKDYIRDVDGWSALMHSDDRESMVNYLKNHVIIDKQPFNKEYRVVSIDKKQQKWVHGRGELRYNDKGAPVIMIGIIEDISERKKTQKLIEEKSKEIDLFFNAALDLLCVADTDGNFLRINPEWQDVLGYSEEELLNHKFLDFVHPDDLHKTMQAISELTKQKRVFNFINRYRCKNGNYKYIEWKSAPAGKLIYAAARDISEHIDYEEKLKKINDELKETSYQKDKFLSIIAHDIRNPLNNLLGLVELLNVKFDSYTKEETRNLVNLLEDSSRQLYRLIENLLEWALSKTENTKPHIQIVDLKKLILDTNDMIKSVASSKDIKVITEFSGKVKVKGDPNMTRTILRNLILNAIKFSYTGGKILVSVKELEGYICTSVKDEGIGIKPEKAKIIFLPHENHVSKGTAGETGSGFGLPLCKELVTKQKGDIWVESLPNKGSCFFFTLPVA